MSDRRCNRCDAWHRRTGQLYCEKCAADGDSVTILKVTDAMHGLKILKLANKIGDDLTDSNEKLDCLERRAQELQQELESRRNYNDTLIKQKDDAWKRYADWLDDHKVDTRDMNQFVSSLRDKTGSFRYG